MKNKYKLIKEIALHISNRYRLDYDHCLTVGVSLIDKDIWNLPDKKLRGYLFDAIREIVCPRRRVQYRLYAGDIDRCLQEGLDKDTILKKYKLGEAEYEALREARVPFITKDRTIRYSNTWDFRSLTEEYFDEENKETSSMLIDKFFANIEDFDLTEEEMKLCVIILTDYGLDYENDTQEILELFGFKYETQLTNLFNRLEVKLRLKSPFRVKKDG